VIQVIPIQHGISAAKGDKLPVKKGAPATLHERASSKSCWILQSNTHQSEGAVFMVWGNKPPFFWDEPSKPCCCKGSTLAAVLLPDVWQQSILNNWLQYVSELVTAVLTTADKIDSKPRPSVCLIWFSTLPASNRCTQDLRTNG
jgi:hypothetical protein